MKPGSEINAVQAPNEPCDDGKDEAVWTGIELLDGRSDANQVFQDLCMTLDLTQVKQVNELVKLLIDGGKS